tara:strand:- start:3433 stop:4764 length:1332 start_codon:yes stop_codon:yes gene_type:complete
MFQALFYCISSLFTILLIFQEKIILEMINKNFFKDSSLYIISDAFFGGLPIILLPLFSYYLLPEEFGLYANILVLMNLFSVFIDFSGSGYYGINFHLKNNDFNRDQIFMNSISVMLINLIILFIIVSLSLDQISDFLKLSYFDIFICLFFAIITNINTLYLTKLRFFENVNLFVRLRLMQVFFHCLFAVFFVIILDYSWEGRYYGHFLSIFIIFPIVIYHERNNIKFINFFNSSYKHLFAPYLFGLSLLPHVLASWIKTGLDRVLLTNSENISANGIYSTAFQLSMVLVLLGVGFNKAFTPLIYKLLSKKDFKNSRILLLQFFGLNFIATIVLLIIYPFIVKLFLSEEYISVLPITPYVIIAQGFLNIYIIASSILFFLKQTSLLSFISIISAIIHVLFLYILVNEYLEFGAAISFLISAIIQTILVVFLVLTKAPGLWKSKI